MSTRAASRRSLSRQGAYTYLEILIAISLVLIVMVITSPRLGKELIGRSEIKSGAMKLVEDLRYLRQLAIASGTPTALVIPSDNLTKSHCQGYLLKKGLVDNEILRAVDFQRLFRKGSVFVGYWNLDTSKLQNPALGNSGAPLARYTNSSGFDVGSWGNGSKDYIFLFTPEGTVITNGNMPHFDNEYHIVVGECYTYGDGGLLPGSDTSVTGSLSSHFAINACWDPLYTVSITPAGEISFEPGLLAAAPGIYSASSPQSPGSGSSLNGTTVSLYAPVIKDIVLFPQSLKLPPGIDANVNRDRYLKMVVTATDADRNHLFLKPQVTQSPGSEKGTFSSPGYIPMEYDPATGEYRGVAEWFPPETSADDQDFEISLAVSDGSQEATETRRINIVVKDQIVFYTNRDGNNEIYAMYVDGSCPTNLTESGSDDRCASWSLTTGLVAFISNRMYGTDDVYIMNGDGGNPVNVTQDLAVDKDPSWALDGARVAYVTSSFYGTDGVVTCYADGSEKADLTYPWGGGLPQEAPAWSPDCIKVAFSSDLYGGATGAYDIFVKDLSKFWESYTDRHGHDHGYWTSNDPVMLTAWDDNAVDTSPCWSPDGSEIVFSTSRDGNNEIYIMDEYGNNQQNITNNAGEDVEPSFSPDGAKIVFSSNRDGNWEIYIMNKDGTGQTNISNNAAQDRMPQYGR